MAASCSPCPHVNLFGVRTAYGPLPAPAGWTRAGRVAGTVLGFIVGTSSFARAMFWKR